MLTLTYFPCVALSQSTLLKYSLKNDLHRAQVKTLDFHKVHTFQRVMKKRAMQEISPFWATHPLIARVFTFHLVLLMFVFSGIVAISFISALFSYFVFDSQYLLASATIGVSALLLDWISLSILLNEGKFMHAAVHINYVKWETYSLDHYPYTIPRAQQILLEKVAQLGDVFVQRLYADPFAYVVRGHEREYVCCWDNDFDQFET